MSLVLVNIIKENKVELPPKYRERAINSAMISQLKQGKRYARFNFFPVGDRYKYEWQAKESADYITTSSTDNTAKNIVIDTRRQGNVTISTANIIWAAYMGTDKEEINVTCLDARSRQVSYRVKERLEEFVARVNAIEVSESSSPTSSPTSVTPVHELYFEGTLSAANLDTNAVLTNYTWDDAEEHANITHNDGDSTIAFVEAGEYDLYYNIEVTDATANNRSTWRLSVDYQNAAGVSQFEYVVGTNYVRDDFVDYDSGGIAGHIMLIIGAGEKVVVLSRRLDTQDAPDDNPANDTKSYLRIFRKTYTLS